MGTHLLGSCRPVATQDASMRQEGAEIAIFFQQLQITGVIDVQ